MRLPLYGVSPIVARVRRSRTTACLEGASCNCSMMDLRQQCPESSEATSLCVATAENFGTRWRAEEYLSSAHRLALPAQLAGSHGAPVAAGPRQLDAKAVGQAGSPRPRRSASSLTRPLAPPRCSRSALLTLRIAPAAPAEGLRGAGRLQLGMT